MKARWSAPWVAWALITAGCAGVPEVADEQSGREAACPEIPAQECPVCEARACPGAPVVERVVEKRVEVPTPVPATAGELNLPVIGAVEWVTLDPPGLRLEARIDTGTETTSVHAENVQQLEKDGQRYVQFELVDPESGEVHAVEAELVRRINVKKGESLIERRYVVRMWVTMGEDRSLIEVSLSNRPDFDYPLMIGRNFLTDVAVVDVSQRHLLD